MGEAAEDAYEVAMREECVYGFPGVMHLPDGKCPSGKENCWHNEGDEE